jgi:hypothetical protein
METVLTPIVVAIIGIIVPAATLWSNRQTRRENAEQHGQSRDALSVLASEVGDVNRSVGRVEEKLDSHLKDPNAHAPRS